MDDALLGGSSVEEVIELRRQITEICSAGNFTIKKWISNSLEIIESIPEDLRLHGEKNLDEKSLFPSERVLGLWWNPLDDSFSFKLNFHKVKPEVLQGNRPTKREMTSLVMSLYDPLGFIGNYKVKGMILLQNTWRSGVGWDDEVPDEIFENWKLWLEELPGITTVKIPRWYGQGVDDDGEVELHTFVDASEEAYCAVSYYRTGNGEKLVLVSSKVKMASLRKMTIPRLELQAAVLGANLANTISDEIKVKVKRFYFWSDSTTVLSWLRNPTSKFQEFVANRIGRIQEITKIEDWRWVPTADNVADEATRLKKPTDLSTESRWFQAPSFLRRPKEEWPAEKKLCEDSQVTTAAADGDEAGEDIGDVFIPRSLDPLLPPIERFSSYSRLVRATAAVKAAFGFWKAKTVTKGKPDPVWKLTSSHFTSGITAEDMKEAELKLIRFVQNTSYPTMVMKLDFLGDKKMKVLSPFIDPTDGILKSAGRLANSKHIDDEQKYPIILPQKHPFTQLLIMREHVQNGHTGQMTTLNNLRKRFWIMDGLQAVKRCSRNCWKCKLERAKPIPALMGNLPSYRTASGSPAFSYTGVDYFGPMEVTVGRRHEKRWGVLFTDLVIRGVHLEVAHGLTTDEMILALSRFVDIRGRPKLMISDNGTNLVGASNELKNAVASLDYQKIMEQEKFMEIKWTFIPAASPHLGGAWERMVQSVKKVLMSVLREKYPKDTTLLTVMKTAENVVNSRPLSALSSDIGDPVALTPNHFFRGQVDMGPSIPVDLKERDEYYRTRWQYSQALSEEFWRRWALEVLPNLRKREKWNESGDPLQVGDIVLMVDDQLPRNCWVKAVVTATFPGSDGHVRVAEVTRRFYGLKADKTYKRSVMKLCPLGLQMEKPVAKAPDLGAGNVGV